LKTKKLTLLALLLGCAVRLLIFSL